MKTRRNGHCLVLLLVLVLSIGSLAHAQLQEELISLGKPATANPGEWSANQANDGNLETRWATGNDQYPAWWQVDLGAQYDLTRLEIHWYGQEARAYRYKVEVGATGADFAVVFDQLDNTTFGPTDASLNVRGRYVRITLEGAHPGGWPSINEVLIYGTPVEDGELDLEALWQKEGNRELAAGRPAKANQEGFPAAHANDGKLDTRWGTIDGSFPAYWQVDLGSVYTLKGLAVNWYNEATRAHQYRIEVSKDGQSFTTVLDRTDNRAFGATMDALEVEARFLRITITGAYPGGWPSICEVRVYGQ